MNEPFNGAKHLRKTTAGPKALIKIIVSIHYCLDPIDFYCMDKKQLNILFCVQQKKVIGLTKQSNS